MTWPINFPPVDTKSGFFRFQAPETEEEVEEFVTNLEKRQAQYYRFPTHPSQRLSLMQWRMSHRTFHAAHGTRRIPPILGLDLFNGMESIELTLEQGLYTGWSKWSQIWIATLASRDAPNVSPASAIVKIFQESLFPFLPDDQDFLGYILYANWFPGAHLCAREEWAYNLMESLQGDKVPRSYGFFQCRLPNGETAFGHVMEHIDGFNARDERAGSLVQDQASTSNVADRLAIAIHPIHCCGVAHMDISPGNVMFLSGYAGNDPRVVIIDFAFCRVFKHMVQRAQDTDASSMWPTLETMGVSRDRVVVWNRSRRDKGLEWRVMFDHIDRYPAWLERPVFNDK